MGSKQLKIVPLLGIQAVVWLLLKAFSQTYSENFLKDKKNLHIMGN